MGRSDREDGLNNLKQAIPGNDPFGVCLEGFGHRGDDFSQNRILGIVRSTEERFRVQSYGSKDHTGQVQQLLGGKDCF